MATFSVLGNRSFDLWFKADSIAAAGGVNTPTYSRTFTGVLGDLQPVTQAGKMAAGLDTSVRYRKAFLPDSVTNLPIGAVLVDTGREEYWRLDEDATPELWDASDGFGIGHWEAFFSEIISVPAEVLAAY